LASGRQYGNALLGVRYQEEEVHYLHTCLLLYTVGTKIVQL